MARSNNRYQEHKQPATTTFYLVRGRKDVRIGDINIFYHDISDAKYIGKVSIKNFSIHKLWPDVHSFMATNDEKLRNEINSAIKIIKADGSYDLLYQKYKHNLVGVK